MIDEVEIPEVFHAPPRAKSRRETSQRAIRTRTERLAGHRRTIQTQSVSLAPLRHKIRKGKNSMLTIPVNSLKIALPFRAGSLPSIDPGDPTFQLELDGLRIQGRVNAKAARKLAVWQGGAVLQGRLINESGRLVLLDCGFSWSDPRPVGEPSPLASPPVGSSSLASPATLVESRESKP